MCKAESGGMHSMQSTASESRGLHECQSILLCRYHINAGGDVHAHRLCAMRMLLQTLLPTSELNSLLTDHRIFKSCEMQA
jgi:hypothetical protein